MRRIALIAALSVSAPALAYTHDSFYGWAPDGSFYATSSSGTDMLERPEVCLSDAKAGSKKWPKDIARPSDGSCTSLCDEDRMECAEPEKAKKWVRLPIAKKIGPHGETIRAKIDRGQAKVTVLAGGRKIAEATVELGSPSERPALRQAYWRPDGGAVAVYLGTNDGGDTDGYPPPRYLAVLSLNGASGDRGSAEVANARGMKLYRAKDYARAEQEFRGAIASDVSYVVPHYNLACVAALRGDKKTAVAELKWLAASSDPAARAKLEKGKTDPDLKSVIDDPQVQKLMSACDCDAAQDRCERDCTEKLAPEAVRGCVRLCTSSYDDCSSICQ